MTKDSLSLPFVGVVVALLVALLCLVTIRRLVVPTSHLLAGRYDKARLAADRLATGWTSALVPGLRVAATYTAASAEHLAGRLEESLRLLTPLTARHLNANLRYAIRSLEAANLLLLDRDHARALAAITEARALQDSPEDLLFTAHALVSLGRTAEADDVFDRAAAPVDDASGGARSGRGAGPIKTAMFHYLRGAYLARLVRGDRGRNDFAAAAESRVPSVYATRARQALEGRAPVPSQIDEPVSSLSAVVVSPFFGDLPPSRRSRSDS